MKKYFLSILILSAMVINAQNKRNNDSKTSYKKRVLDNTEVNFLYSNYLQNGNHAAVTGGVGNEHLTDNTPAILINVPLNADDVLSVDFGVDLTTSASTDQINPFAVGTSKGNNGGERDRGGVVNTKSSGTILPTGASTGGGGVLVNGVVVGSEAIHKRTHAVIGFTSTSNDRSFTWGADGSFSTERGYNSIGAGIQLRKSFNHENSEFNFNSKAYLDKINPIYPGEFRASEGLPPSVGFKLLNVTHRNSYSGSLSFSQVINKRMQISVIADIIYQEGLLSTNYQRIYFKDKPIKTYKNVQLANDIERLPATRVKHPFGVRFNYFVTDNVVLRTFYRHYSDDWGINANTYDVQIPLILSPAFTLYPMYRYHSQQQSRYFAPKSQHLSTEIFYTSDYDLSTFNSSQYGMGFTIAPPLGIFKLNTSNQGNPFRFKSFDFRYNYYSRSDGLSASIFSLNAQFTF